MTTHGTARVEPRPCDDCEGGYRTVERYCSGLVPLETSEPCRTCNPCAVGRYPAIDAWEFRRGGKMLGDLSAREHDREDAETLATVLELLSDDEAEEAIEDYAATGHTPPLVTERIAVAFGKGAAA